MKVACLLPLPLLLVPFTHAADYLIRFKEGVVTASASNQHRVSRIENFISVQSKGGVSPTFDYSSNELAITVLSLSQARALATHGKSTKHSHKSKAQVETEAATALEDEETEETIHIKSKGRWYTFDDTEFHVWHGDFTEAEAELLAKDAGVEVLEKDVEIRFPELEQYNSQTAARAVLDLEQAYDLVDEHLANLELKNTSSKKKLQQSDEESEVRIPNVDDNEDDSESENESPPHKAKTSKKAHTPTELVQPVTAKDIPGPNNAYTIQQRAPSWVSFHSSMLLCYCYSSRYLSSAAVLPYRPFVCGSA